MYVTQWKRGHSGREKSVVVEIAWIGMDDWMYIELGNSIDIITISLYHNSKFGDINHYCLTHCVKLKIV